MSAIGSNLKRTDATGASAAERSEAARAPGRWLLVTGDFTPLGGMDRANFALADYLARNGAEVHLVSHRVHDDLKAFPNVHVHQIPRPFGKHLLGAPLLAIAGRIWARRLRRLDAGTRFLVNGGNCPAGDDINWVQYVHAAWKPLARGGPAARFKAAVAHVWSLRDERRTIKRARIIITNSNQTSSQLIDKLGIPKDRLRTVYLGADADRFAAIEPAERIAARREIGIVDEVPIVAFVGSMGDRRKGFDTLYDAWLGAIRSGSSAFGAGRLVVVGAGSSLAYWRDRARREGAADSIAFLGFRRDVPRVLAACDVLVSPTRYEAYGLNVQEALCRGLPAIVSARAGIAERYPRSLQRLLLNDPEDPAELAEKMLIWYNDRREFAAAASLLGAELRSRTWDDCAAEIVAIALEQSTENRGESES